MKYDKVLDEIKVLVDNNNDCGLIQFLDRIGRTIESGRIYNKSYTDRNRLMVLICDTILQDINEFRDDYLG